MKIETGEQRSLWHKYFRIAVLNYNTYHASICCEPFRIFHGRIACNILHLKLGKRPQQGPFATSQIAQDDVDQTQMIYQYVRRTTMQADINYKAYYDKKTNASKLREADYVHVLPQKADRQGSKFHFTEFRWTCPYIIEKVLLNHLVRKIGTNKTQALHRMRMRQFTHQQLLPYIRITPQEWKIDPEVSVKPDDLYARAWERENESPNFDSENHIATPPNSLEIAVQSDLSTEDTWNRSQTAGQPSQDFFPKRKNIVT